MWCIWNLWKHDTEKKIKESPNCSKDFCPFLTPWCHSTLAARPVKVTAMAFLSGSTQWMWDGRWSTIQKKPYHSLENQPVAERFMIAYKTLCEDSSNSWFVWNWRPILECKVRKTMATRFIDFFIRKMKITWEIIYQSDLQ